MACCYISILIACILWCIGQVHRRAAPSARLFAWKMTPGLKCAVGPGSADHLFRANMSAPLAHRGGLRLIEPAILVTVHVHRENRVLPLKQPFGKPRFIRIVADGNEVNIDFLSLQNHRSGRVRRSGCPRLTFSWRATRSTRRRTDLWKSSVACPLPKAAQFYCRGPSNSPSGRKTQLHPARSRAPRLKERRCTNRV